MFCEELLSALLPAPRDLHTDGARSGGLDTLRSTAMTSTSMETKPQAVAPKERLGLITPSEPVTPSNVNAAAHIEHAHIEHSSPLHKEDVKEAHEIFVRRQMRRKFPMFVIPVRKVLEMTKIKRHEEVMDLLVEWNPGMGDVLFVSHSWKHWEEPDRDNVRLDLLKAVLGKIVKGKTRDITTHIRVEGKDQCGKDIDQMVIAALRDGYVWMDVMSTPQEKPDLHTGLTTLPMTVSYAADATFFCELAHTWRHGDGTVRDLRGLKLPSVEIWWSRHNSGRITVSI